MHPFVRLAMERKSFQDVLLLNSMFQTFEQTFFSTFAAALAMFVT